MDLIKLPEPTLTFRYAQALEDPRDGLTLFGPLDDAKPYGIRSGVIGTQSGIKIFNEWIKRIIRPVSCSPARLSRPPFPGFEATFQIPWGIKPHAEICLRDLDIDAAIYQSDRHHRVYKAVDLYAEPIISATKNEDAHVDIWFVMIPDRVKQYCRPQSNVGTSLRLTTEGAMAGPSAKNTNDQPFLFAALNEDARPYQFEPHFHNQLKARVLTDRILTQIVQHKTIADPQTLSDRDAKTAKLMQSQIAWNISTTTFYKTGGRPWKLNGIRPGVCYVGIVFKQDQRTSDVRNACCAAQMFLDSGDGVVFKGAVGPWYNPKRGDFHLDRRAARELIDVAIKSYTERFGSQPVELFIHGKVEFDDEEWAGFTAAGGTATKVIGVTIRDRDRLKVFSLGQVPILRGMASIQTPYSGFLWTRGFVPRLKTYPGLEVPNPLSITIKRGDADIRTVMQDILALTKLNYNACNYGDGVPVTLKFADAVGEILTAGPINGNTPPLPFRHYI